jgi:hypothetical protein
MVLSRNINVEPAILERTQCNLGYACLSGKHACNVEPFIDRELQLLRCRDTRACGYRKQYLGQFICTCPVNRASFGITN